MKTPDVLQLIAAAPPMAEKLARVRKGEASAFEHIVTAARATLAAVLARGAKRRVWIVCEMQAAQEALHNELLHWLPDALFYPEQEIAPVEGAIADPENVAERLAVLHRVSSFESRVSGGSKPETRNQKPETLPSVVVLTKASLDEAVPTSESFGQLETVLKRGTRLDRDKLLRQLADAGYEHVAQVSQRGQFAVRGGILDVFSFHHSLPARVELFGDEIDSLRHFDLDAQTSVQQVEAITLLLGDAAGAKRTCRLADLIGDEDLTIDAGGSWLAAQVRFLEGAETTDGSTTDYTDGTDTEQTPHGGASSVPSVISVVSSSADSVGEDFSCAFFDHGLGEFAAGDFIVDEHKREGFFDQLGEWRRDGWHVHIFCNNEGEIERLRELVPPVEADALHFSIGPLSRGFTFPAGKLALLSDAELFGRYRNTRSRRMALQRARLAQTRVQIDFSELTEGELVVHLEHGIGRYDGMRTVPRGETTEDVLVLEFAERAKLYVPLEQSFMVSRYVGVGKRNPPLSTLGDPKWARAKKSAEKSVFDYAGQLLRHHAERETQVGHAFPPDTKWEQEFEASFLYKETPDQISAIATVKADMETARPMDRLICGDVGFGKTEVAIRAAFKAVMGGKQVALLVPTTVLAEQHYRTLRERMSDYPITVDLLSRFRTQGEQRKTVQGLLDGSVDIVVGTHRLISKDIVFKNLGLVVIDEEQRFGVLHKERFKEMFRLVDMLTLSATPIPRTLYLSLMGAKDMSTIETPPANRIPIETLICPYDERIIRDAINRELARQGQVYFLHNRIESIQKVARRIGELCPNARVLTGHGQMDEHELEDVMHKFVNAEADVLVSTTIIESGLDIPNANTIIIDRADRFGLADLYQLRGRVGRAQHKAYAYLMLPAGLMTVGEARRRINAIKQYSSLGAGFKIAMRDLEIRGAGNILGTQQSGHIISIGFDLYCALLRQAVAKLKGEAGAGRLEVVLKLDFVALREAEIAESPGLAPAFLPTSYIAESAPRIQAYRRLAEVGAQEQLDALRETWRDRFGPLPEAAENLLRLTALKVAAQGRQFSVVEVREDRVMLMRAGSYVQIGGKFPRVQESDPTRRLLAVLKLIESF
ncbi:MAG: transcription-repair coupling factor [Chthoniobacteraceae bacterium]